jgi:hypothetical protein
MIQIATDLRTRSGAMEIRTPDLLHAIPDEPVRNSPEWSR